MAGMYTSLSLSLSLSRFSCNSFRHILFVFPKTVLSQTYTWIILLFPQHKFRWHISFFFVSTLSDTFKCKIPVGEILGSRCCQEDISTGLFIWMILMLKELWCGFLDHGTRQTETQLIMHLWSLCVRLHQHVPHTSLLWNSPSQIPGKNLIVQKRSAWLIVPWLSTIQFVTSPSHWPFFFSFEAKFPLAFASSLVTSLRAYGAAWPWAFYQ